MRPATDNFRQYLIARYPMKPNELLVKEYFYRLSNMPRFQKAGITQRRMKDLWYGNYGKCEDDFSTDERLAIFGKIPADKFLKRFEENQALLRDLEEIKTEINGTVNEFRGIKRKLGEALLT